MLTLDGRGGFACERCSVPLHTSCPKLVYSLTGSNIGFITPTETLHIWQPGVAPPVPTSVPVRVQLNILAAWSPDNTRLLLQLPYQQEDPELPFRPECAFLDLRGRVVAQQEFQLTARHVWGPHGVLQLGDYKRSLKLYHMLDGPRLQLAYTISVPGRIGWLSTSPDWTLVAFKLLPRRSSSQTETSLAFVDLLHLSASSAPVVKPCQLEVQDYPIMWLPHCSGVVCVVSSSEGGLSNTEALWTMSML